MKKEAGGPLRLPFSERIREPLFVLELALAAAAAAATAKVADRCGCVWCKCCELLEPTAELGEEELAVGDSSE